MPAPPCELWIDEAIRRRGRLEVELDPVARHRQRTGRSWGQGGSDGCIPGEALELEEHLLGGRTASLTVVATAQVPSAGRSGRALRPRRVRARRRLARSAVRPPRQCPQSTRRGRTRAADCYAHEMVLQCPAAMAVTAAGRPCAYVVTSLGDEARDPGKDGNAQT